MISSSQAMLGCIVTAGCIQQTSVIVSFRKIFVA